MKHFLFINLLIIVGFSRFESGHLHNQYANNYLDTSKYAVFSYDKEYWPASFGKDSKSYNLSLDDIKQIEILLNKKVININKEAKEKIIKNPSTFYKQLIAVYNLKGEKLVWVNCMCYIDDAPDWKKRIIEVLDGGPCYFNFKVNLTTGAVYDFEINGVG